MLVSICCYYFYKWCSDVPYEEYEHLEPYKCWKLVDDGIFALLDNIEDEDYYDDYQEMDDGIETRSNFEKRLAADKLQEKNFQQVRRDTY